MEEKQRISTKALIRKEGKILMLCEPNGKWELPGGKPDFGEHMEDTIKRELREELGVESPEVRGVCGQFDFISECPQYDTVYQFVIVVFLVDIPDSEIALSHEHVEYHWCTLEEIDKLNIKPEYKAFLHQILSS